MEQAVVEVSAFDLDVVSQIEASFERARRDTLIEVFGVVPVLLPARHRELAGFRSDADLVAGEARDSGVDLELVLSLANMS